MKIPSVVADVWSRFVSLQTIHAHEIGFRTPKAAPTIRMCVQHMFEITQPPRWGFVWALIAAR